MSNWKHYIKNFEAYLKIEKSLSQNSVDAYLHDVQLLQQYLDIENNNQAIFYFNKWTKMNKNPNYILTNITDVSYQPNKTMALLSDNKVYFIDSNFNFKTSPNFFPYTFSSSIKYQTFLSCRIHYNTHIKANEAATTRIVY